jgi:hypothetical protein
VDVRRSSVFDRARLTGWRTRCQRARKEKGVQALLRELRERNQAALTKCDTLSRALRTTFGVPSRDCRRAVTLLAAHCRCAGAYCCETCAGPSCVLLRGVCCCELCVAASCVLLRAVCCCCEACVAARRCCCELCAAASCASLRVLWLRALSLRVCVLLLESCRCASRAVANEARPRTSGRWHNDRWRGVAQPGSALALGARCREFESPHPDQIARPALCVAGWRFGKRHAYARAGAVGARMDLHRAAEAIHRLLHDGKTEAGTVARRSGHAVEAL